MDRRKLGTKYTLLVDRHGIPLAVRPAGANASDHRLILPTVLDFPAVGGKPGRPKGLPDELYADRGYDSSGTRTLLAWLGIEPHIARQRTPHGSGPGRVRWVVERTIGRLKGLCRLRVRYDRLGGVQDAWARLRYNPSAWAVYERLSRGKARKKQAVVALARKILVRCWAMLRDNAAWRPDPEPTAAA